jgi:hypothetical protein
MIAGAIMFMVFALIMQMNNISSQIEENNLIQSHYTATMEILSYDLHKIGYKAEGEKILYADADSIKYCVDLKDDGTTDTLSYRAIPVHDESAGNTIWIYRKVNKDKHENIGVVSDFTLSYFDSLGNTINYGDLISTEGRERIRSLEILLEMTVGQKDTTGYNDINWRVRIKPKNLLFRN